MPQLSVCKINKCQKKYNPDNSPDIALLSGSWPGSKIRLDRPDTGYYILELTLLGERGAGAKEAPRGQVQVRRGRRGGRGRAVV